MGEAAEELGVRVILTMQLVLAPANAALGKASTKSNHSYFSRLYQDSCPSLHVSFRELLSLSLSLVPDWGFFQP